MKLEVSHEGFQNSQFFNPVIITTPARRSYSQKEAYETTGPANSDIFYGTLDDHSVDFTDPGAALVEPDDDHLHHGDQQCDVWRDEPAGHA